MGAQKCDVRGGYGINRPTFSPFSFSQNLKIFLAGIHSYLLPLSCFLSLFPLPCHNQVKVVLLISFLTTLLSAKNIKT